MKPSEVMIGDWVYDKHHKKNILLTAYDFFSHWLTTGSKPAMFSDKEPILLTEAILELNGFEKHEEEDMPTTYYIRGLGIKWHKDGGYFYIDSPYVDIRIVFVHQIQQTLRLCGLNELADNFKVE